MGGSINDLSPDLIPFAQALVDAAGAAGLLPRITSTLRTHSEQGRLYRGYLANPLRAYPVAPPGYSAHEYGEAFDMVVSPMEALADVGATWLDWGGGWNPRDAVHFELPGASERARQAGDRARGTDLPWYEKLAEGLPFGLGASIIFDYFNIPVAARKDVTPEQLAYLASLVPK